jgi:hypothetical protein
MTRPGSSLTDLWVLVDADNVAPRRLQPVLDLLADLDGVRLIASGSESALGRVRWPAAVELLPHAGWQRADAALAEAYAPSCSPLLLASGDGDFGLLAARHPGPVLVVSGAPSGRLRDTAVIVDPATDGVDPIRQWLRAVGVISG